MSHLENMKNTYNSGDVGTTGREPFETPGGNHASSNQGHIAGSGPGSGAQFSLGQNNHDHTGDDCRHESHRSGGLSGLTGDYSHEHTGDGCVHESHRHNHTGDDCVHESHRGAKTGVVGGLTGGSHHHDHEHTGDNCVHESHRSHQHGTDSYGVRGGDNDRTGNLQQGISQFETSGRGGPTTSGAAGTDRFDSDRHHSSTGATSGGPISDTYGHNHGNNAGTEGVKSALTTSDKEFTNRDRLGPAGGAYTDTDGRFETNTSGPHGNSALTGREGNFDTNPVSGKTGGAHVSEHTDEMGSDRAARATGTREDGAEGTAHGHAADGKEAPHGILGKIKAALH